MKTKYAAVIVAVGLGLAATLFAADNAVVIRHAAGSASKIIMLKSHGVAVAELRLLNNDIVLQLRANQINSQTENDNATTGVTTAKGEVTIQLGSTGDSPITIKADEADVISVAE